MRLLSHKVGMIIGFHVRTLEEENARNNLVEICFIVMLQHSSKREWHFWQLTYHHYEPVESHVERVEPGTMHDQEFLTFYFRTTQWDNHNRGER